MVALDDDGVAGLCKDYSFECYFGHFIGGEGARRKSGVRRTEPGMILTTGLYSPPLGLLTDRAGDVFMMRWWQSGPSQYGCPIRQAPRFSLLGAADQARHFNQSSS